MSEELITSECMGQILPIQDALYVLSGKWKLPILISLSFGTKRFGAIKKDIPKITDRMLSKELKEMEINQLVVRKMYDTFPVTVEYSLTEHAETLRNAINELSKWGKTHRKKITIK